MTSSPLLLRLASLLSLSMLAFLAVAADNQPRPVAKAVPLPRIADRTKMVRVERPVRQVVVRNSARVSGAAAVASNPKVKPGLVKWHADFAAACQASRKSGKPVLLFQMMGKLDDQFC